MKKPDGLREPMDMPNPYFPIKVHHTTANEYGRLLFSNHWHEHVEIICVISGSMIVEINSVPHRLEAGDVAYMNSNDLHAGICLSEDLFYYALIANLSLLHSPAQDSAETKFIAPLARNRILIRNKLTDPAPVQAAVHAIVHELAHKEIGFELSIKSYLYRILATLVRSEVELISTEEEYRSRMRNLERITPVLEDIESNYREDLKIDRLAKQIGLSRFHFSRMFKEVTGRTVTEYILGVRMNRAEYLLRNSDMTVTEVAYETGFRDIYYFSRVFKHVKKVTPTGARKQKS